MVKKPLHRYSAHPSYSRLADELSCGSSMAGRIVGGSEAMLGQYPWLVNLGYAQTGKSKTVYNCGGTLIGKIFSCKVKIKYFCRSEICVDGRSLRYPASPRICFVHGQSRRS